MNALSETIISGVIKKPRIVTLYGEPGIGKSTWAADAPNCIFVPTEDGVSHIDCDKFPVAKTVYQFNKHMQMLYTEEHKYKWVVIDSVDWLEQLLIHQVCDEKEVTALSEIPYGKGKGFAYAKFERCINAITRLSVDKQLNIIMLAHCKIETVNDPEVGSYDRFAPRLQQETNDKLIEWSDDVLFAKFKTFIRTEKGDFGKETKKAIGTTERIIKCSSKPGVIAKNRCKLPDEIDMNFATYLNKIQEYIL